MILSEKNQKKSFERQQGFTLMEIIIALFIFAIGIMGVTMMQTTALNSTKLSRQRSIANSLITSQMEQTILSTPYANLTNGSAQQDHYDISWTVDPDANNSREVHLTIAWQEGYLNKSVNFDVMRVRVN